jgi:hypothetical protein
MAKLSVDERQGSERIRFVDRDGMRILMVDLSVCTAREAEETVRRVPDVVTAEPRGSLLILTDFKGSSFDSAALRAIKETAVFDKPFVKKSALVGTLSLPREFHDEMKEFSRRDFAIFGTREEAMQWLVES